MPTATLPDRAVIRLSGDDRHSFLQGLISNDVNTCQPGHPIFAALLTPQGKFLHELFVIDAGDTLLLETEAGRHLDLMQRLTRHKLRARITLTDAPDLAVSAIWNEPPPVADAAEFLYPDTRFADMGFRLINAKRDQLEKPSSYDLYDIHRLTCGIPAGSRDLTIEKSTLLEANFDLLNGISWTKGCYMGQELTARTHYRGLVKKRLYPVTLDDIAPEMNQPVYLGDQEIGDMRSTQGPHGIALLNIEKAQQAIISGQTLRTGTTAITPMLPRWAKTLQDTNIH